MTMTMKETIRMTVATWSVPARHAVCCSSLLILLAAFAAAAQGTAHGKVEIGISTPWTILALAAPSSEQDHDWTMSSRRLVVQCSQSSTDAASQPSLMV
jgi:hypothetical protein